MAKTIFIDPAFTLGGSDLVARVSSVSFSCSINVVETSSVDSRDATFILGSQSYSLSVTMNDDDTMDGVLNTALTGAVPIAWTLRRSSGSISATNPSYSGSVLLTDLPVVDGSRGELMSRTINLTGTGSIARATS